MKEINGCLLCEVPEGASDFSISYELAPYCVWLNMKGRQFPMPIGNAILPAKKVEIIGLAKDLSEEQWKGIVRYDHKMKCGWPYYKYEGEDTTATHAATATISGHSLLKANNLNPNNCLILKKENQ